MRKYVLLVAVAAVAVFAVYRLRAPGPEVTPVSSGAPGRDPRVPDDPAVARPTHAALDVQLPSYKSIADRYPHGHDMSVMLERNPHVARLLDFRNRPLLDASAREEYEEFFSSVEVIHSARAALLDPGSAAYSISENIAREANVDFFDMAMSWEANPARGLVMDTIEEIVLHDNFVPEQVELNQKSLATSKINLLKLLQNADPERARALAARTQGTRMEALIAYALDQPSRDPDHRISSPEQRAARTPQ
jgi:hypothetical protein